MPIPTQQGIRCDQSVELAQQLASERVRLSGQPAAFGIGKTKVLLNSHYTLHVVSQAINQLFALGAATHEGSVSPPPS
jgi:hypothetical protein